MSKEIFETLRGMITQGALEDALEQLDSVLSSQGNTAFSQTAQYREFRREVGTHLGVLRSNRRSGAHGIARSPGTGDEGSVGCAWQEARESVLPALTRFWNNRHQLPPCVADFDSG